MPCTCLIENGEVTEPCDTHRKLSAKSYNRAIEAAAKLVMFSVNEEWLVKKIRELKVSEEASTSR